MLSCFTRVQLFVTLRAVARQAPLSIGFSGQEYWGGLPCPSPGGLPDPETEHESFMSSALASRSFTTGATWEVHKLSLGTSILLFLNFFFKVFIWQHQFLVAARGIFNCSLQALIVACGI